MDKMIVWHFVPRRSEPHRGLGDFIQLQLSSRLYEQGCDNVLEVRQVGSRVSNLPLMASTHASLDAASSERKARLAKLASLKRKQPDSDTIVDTVSTIKDSSDAPHASKTDLYSSGRNYDPETRGPRLGFENVPSANTITLEQQAEQITLNTAEQAAKDEIEAESGIDLFKLQPKKPNWDLKRDLAEKMKVLDVRTQNAIARLVRERIENSKKEALQKIKARENESAGDEGEEVGIDGSTLVQGVHAREHEEQEDERRDRERDEEDGIA